MTTRSEDFKSEQLKQHGSTHAKKARAKAKLDHDTHATHNQAARAEPRSAYGLEAGSRKSSRATANRSKTDSSIRKTVTVRTSSPEVRATRQKEGGVARKR